MTIVYKYHAEPESPADEKILVDQLRLASAYRRSLVEVENLGRRLRRSASWDSSSDACVAISTAQFAEKRRLRGMFSRELGLGWGTYQHVEESVASAQRSTPLPEDVRRGDQPGYGCVGVHLQPARTLRPDDAWIRVEPDLVRRCSWELTPSGFARRDNLLDRSGRPRPARHTRVLVRVGTLEDRSPKFASLLVLLHRPLPADASISWALVRRRQVGPRARWSISFVAAGMATRADRGARVERAEAVGVDVGWRRVPGGIRVALWRGTDGDGGELVLPERVTGTDDVADRIRRIRDQNRNEIAERIRIWSADHPDREAWAVTATRNVAQWRRGWRFANLINKWRSARTPGDEVIFRQLAEWRKQDAHLWAWEANSREQRPRRIRALAQNLAVDLGRRYCTVVVEAPFVSGVVKKSAGEGVVRDIAGRRVPRAAPASVIAEIRRIAAQHGARVVSVDPAFTTMTCSDCGTVRDDPSIDWSALEIRCPRCGVTKDQDVTAAINLRSASGQVSPSDGNPLAGRKPRIIKKLSFRANRRSSQRKETDPSARNDANRALK